MFELFSLIGDSKIIPTATSPSVIRIGSNLVLSPVRSYRIALEDVQCPITEKLLKCRWNVHSTTIVHHALLIAL